jgi:hypothetical protein
LADKISCLPHVKQTSTFIVMESVKEWIKNESKNEAASPWTKQPIIHIKLLEATCCGQSVEPDLADGVHG